MSELLNYIAHAGEEHSDAVDAAKHLEWYVSLLIFIVVVACVSYLVWIVTNKNKSSLLMTLALLLLISGMTMYELAPIVSILSLVSGMIVAGFLALTGLSK